MTDRLITFIEFGALLAGASGKTARRRADEAGLPIYKIGGRRLIKLSDAEQFIESHRIVRTEAQTLKELVATAVSRAKQRKES